MSVALLDVNVLLALAAAHDAVLATFDRAVAAGLPADSPLLQHLEVIEA